MKNRSKRPRANCAAPIVTGFLSLAAVAGIPAEGAAADSNPEPPSASTIVPMYGMQLSNDCEAASLRMVLAARGVQATDEAILNQIGVDRVHYQFGQSGSLSGNPFRAFVGDPNGSETVGTGFGVYSPPGTTAAQHYGLGILVAGQGIPLEQLRTQVAEGHPAIVWV